jgi:hypothetical protein
MQTGCVTQVLDAGSQSPAHWLSPSHSAPSAWGAWHIPELLQKLLSMQSRAAHDSPTVGPRAQLPATQS